jgi:predicted secreted protein
MIMDNDPGEYHLKAGEKITIDLPNLGAAGYQLLFRTDNDAIVRMERMANTKSAEDDIRIGSAVTVSYTITAVAKGVVNITFYEKRAWETNAKELITREIRIYIQ